MTASAEQAAAPDRPAGPGRPDLPAPLVEGTPVPLVDRHDAVLFDLDGVLYVGPHAVPDAPRVVAELRRRGIAVGYVTNNASRTPATVAAHLTSLGIPAQSEDVVTSAQAVSRLVAEAVPPGSRVLVVGGDGLRAAVRERGLVPVEEAAAEPAAVVQGFGPDVGWRLLAEGTFAVRAGVPWFASNLDATVPTPGGLAPGNGALVDVIATATGKRPQVAGKPETPLHAEAVARTGAVAPLVVGDRLDTDIEGANRAGAPSLLVLTGVTTPLDVVTARAVHRPTYLAPDLRTGLLAPHPSVTATEAGGWRCGGWTCAPAPRLALHGAGDRTDALRALCVAAWHCAEPVSEPTVMAALRSAGW